MPSGKTAKTNARAVKLTERSKHYFCLNRLLKLFCMPFLINILAEWGTAILFRFFLQTPARFRKAMFCFRRRAPYINFPLLREEAKFALRAPLLLSGCARRGSGADTRTPARSHKAFAPFLRGKIACDKFAYSRPHSMRKAHKRVPVRIKILYEKFVPHRRPRNGIFRLRALPRLSLPHYPFPYARLGRAGHLSSRFNRIRRIYYGNFQRTAHHPFARDFQASHARL